MRGGLATSATGRTRRPTGPPAVARAATGKRQWIQQQQQPATCYQQPCPRAGVPPPPPGCPGYSPNLPPRPRRPLSRAEATTGHAPRRLRDMPEVIMAVVTRAVAATKADRVGTKEDIKADTGRPAAQAAARAAGGGYNNNSRPPYGDNRRWSRQSRRVRQPKLPRRQVLVVLRAPGVGSAAAIGISFFA